MRMLPTRSVTNVRASGAKARSHGITSADRTTVGTSRGTLPGGSGTVIIRKTPWSSIHAVPSTTGRRWSEYVPAICGARTWNVNVAFAPGGTLASVSAATRLADIQFTPSGADCA